MRRQRDTFDRAAQMPDASILPHLADRQHGEHVTFAIAQGDTVAGFQRGGLFRVAGERDRQRPEGAVVQLPAGFDACALRARHEPGERRVGAAHQHLQLALLTPVEVERGQAHGFLLERVPLSGIDQVDEGAAVGGDELIHVGSGV